MVQGGGGGRWQGAGERTEAGHECPGMGVHRDPSLAPLPSLQSKGLSRVFSNTLQKHQFFGAQLSLWSNSHIHT